MEPWKRQVTRTKDTALPERGTSIVPWILVIALQEIAPYNSLDSRHKGAPWIGEPSREHIQWRKEAKLVQAQEANTLDFEVVDDTNLHSVETVTGTQSTSRSRSTAELKTRWDLEVWRPSSPNISSTGSKAAPMMRKLTPPDP